jgi:nicotinamidase-related amidase
MPISLHPNTALILVDIQSGFDDPKWGPRNNPQAEQNARRLLLAWRAAKRPIFHVQHASQNPSSPLFPSKPGFPLHPLVSPQDGEPVIVKNVNSAFIGTNLEQQLQARGIRDLVICGLTTPHCVSTTTRMAGNLGFNVYVVADATAAFQLVAPDGTPCDPEIVHRIALAELHGEFAQVVDVESCLV